MRKSIHSAENRLLLGMLKRSRRARGLRQRDLGVSLGRDQAFVSKVESGERRLDVIELRSWLEAMGVEFVSFVRELDEGINASRRQVSAIRRK